MGGPEWASFFMKISSPHPSSGFSLCINTLLLVEAVVFGAYIQDRLASGTPSLEEELNWGPQLQRHSDTLSFLAATESHLASGVSAEQVRDSLATFGAVSVEEISQEERSFLPDQDGMIYIEAVSYQLKALSKQLSSISDS